jgi:hypothetical protein
MYSYVVNAIDSFHLSINTRVLEVLLQASNWALSCLYKFGMDTYNALCFVCVVVELVGYTGCE